MWYSGNLVYRMIPYAISLYLKNLCEMLPVFVLYYIIYLK